MATGEVIAFDFHVGLGTVRSAKSAVEYGFHCTSLADGSRAISVGAMVEFEIVPGGLGRWEATKVVVRDPG